MKDKKVFTKVYDLTRKIPKGKVSTYGEIASILKISPRTVGWALHANYNKDVPCHRVVDKDGRIAKNYKFGGEREQKRRLKKEGVKFKDEKHVDLENFYGSYSRFYHRRRRWCWV